MPSLPTSQVLDFGNEAEDQEQTIIQECKQWQPNEKKWRGLRQSTSDGKFSVIFDTKFENFVTTIKEPKNMSSIFNKRTHRLITSP